MAFKVSDNQDGRPHPNNSWESYDVGPVICSYLAHRQTCRRYENTTHLVWT